MEKRLFKRFELPFKLKYELKNRPMLQKEELGRNISGTGVRLSLVEKLLPKTELTLKVEIKDKTDVVTFNGKVVWARRIEITDNSGFKMLYETGIEFDELNTINTNRIINYYQKNRL